MRGVAPVLSAVCTALLVVTGCGTADAPEPDGEAASSPSSATPSATTTTSDLASPSAPADSGPVGGGEPSSSSSLEASAVPGARPAAELGLAGGWGPTQAELDRAARRARSLSLRELAGQVILARYDGTAPPSKLVRDLHLGGVVVFADNFVSTDQIKAANRALQRGVGRRWPVQIAVDQEGGIVQRIQGDATRFPTFMTAGAGDNAKVTEAAARAQGGELRHLGFTMDFAPVADVTSGRQDPTIGARSAGSYPGLVSRQVVAASAGFRKSGVAPVLKHFPGHGSVPADSHEELPVQRRTLAQLRRNDFVPFRNAVAQHASTVMTGHIDVRAIDPGVPSSLSRKVVTGTLRGELGFRGLVVTDALDMAAITDRYTSAQSAVRTLRAGADIVLMPPDPRAARDGIVAAVRGGQLSRTRVEQAAARQIALLDHNEEYGPGRPPGTSGRASFNLSQAAVTVVAGPCRGRLIGPSVLPVGDADAVAAFKAVAEQAGIGTAAGPTISFRGYGDPATTADIVVATDTPYVLGRSRGRVRVALYGATRGAMWALTDVLLGKSPAFGRLPVRVGGVARPGC
ncbi:glycoside hydrolase family 3 protein [Nocardioides speluncae]|uniref:glycoside hydrolase family 3 protein n=1 Tax=Nocardioides speluncae TaxID=2670337 RepID=UPI000D68CA23|nr:glycoside hydrolase family 3 N-terminal domain-containing protein [Nocardioides speluncae]